MEQQPQQICHRNRLVIRRIDSNPKCFTTSCTLLGTKGQWKCTVTTALINESAVPLPRLMDEARSIMAMNDCTKTCQFYFNNPQQNQQYKPGTFQIKVDCDQKLGKTTFSSYNGVGKCQCIVRTVFANTTKHLLTGRQIGELSIKAMYDCTKLYYNTLNNENLAKQANLEKIIKRIKARK